MTHYPLAKAIEEASLNAWPPLQQLLYDGWVLRFAHGYSRRANSINGLYQGTLELSEKIHHCEQIYQQRGLPSIFRLTPFMDPPQLDTVLEDSGYEQRGLTSVQILDLAAHTLDPARSGEQWDRPIEAWIHAYTSMNGVTSLHHATLKAILGNIVPEACFTSLVDQGQTVACGLGVLEGRYIGLFDIVTHPARRGQGLGSELIKNILTWAKGRGAQTAYLQVMLENTSALRLYHKLGFEELYRYWYRVPA